MARVAGLGFDVSCQFHYRVSRSPAILFSHQGCRLIYMHDFIRGQKVKKILAMLYPGCISFEIMLAIEVLGQKYPVDCVSTDDNPHIDSSNLHILNTIQFSDVNPDDYVAILVPGGNPDIIMDDSRVDDLIRMFHKKKRIIGGMCAGVLVLAKTGILNGSEITHNYTLKYAPPEIVNATESFWTGTIYRDQNCVADGHIITAMPFGFIDFAIKLARILDVFDGKQAEFMRSYYRVKLRICSLTDRLVWTTVNRGL